MVRRRERVPEGRAKTLSEGIVTAIQAIRHTYWPAPARFDLRRVVEREVEKDDQDGRDKDDLQPNEIRRRFLSGVQVRLAAENAALGREGRIG